MGVSGRVSHLNHFHAAHVVEPGTEASERAQRGPYAKFILEHINSKTLTRSSERQFVAARTIPKMARRVVVALLLTAGAALQQPNIQPRALSPQKAVPCAEADALLAQAKFLREQVAIEERQLNALKAQAKPQAVEGKNNILPLERLKAWRTRLSFEGNKVVSAAWTKFQEGGKAEVDGAEAKPQAVEGKNNILPLERLKAW